MNLPDGETVHGFVGFAGEGDKIHRHFLLFFKLSSGCWANGRTRRGWVVFPRWGKYVQAHVLVFAHEISSFLWTSMCLGMRKSPS
jgi:hypothetical protein